MFSCSGVVEGGGIEIRFHIVDGNRAEMKSK